MARVTRGTRAQEGGDIGPRANGSAGREVRAHERGDRLDDSTGLMDSGDLRALLKEAAAARSSILVSRGLNPSECTPTPIKRELASRQLTSGEKGHEGVCRQLESTFADVSSEAHLPADKPASEQTGTRCDTYTRSAISSRILITSRC